ncbi:MAG TPA: FtsX-like permease family protein [bacterium]|nr:FtsX-like permease family protein [bacterium]
MGIFIKLAWRNLFRNSRRTLLASLAIGIGLAALIFTDALIIGMEENMVRSATATFMGEGQIHRQGYLETRELEETIHNVDTVTAMLRREDIVEQFTKRTMTLGMITSPANVSSISIVGINPATEQYLSQIDEAMQQGEYFTGDNPRDVVIGQKLAEILEVDLGGRIVLTVSEAGTGDLSQDMFRISGIFQFGIREMDRGMAFIRLEKSQEMLGLENRAHEIALDFTNAEYGRNEQLPFWDKYSQWGNEAEGWIKVQPELATYLELSQFSTYIVGIILFGVVALGIINTLFMSLHERMFEFGVLRAVGTRPFAMGRLIIFEAGALSILSIGVGIILGFLITYLTTLTGIDYTGLEFLGVTIQEMIYPVMELQQFVEYPILVFLFTTVIGIYPAWHAARMQPAEALRRSF